MTIYLDSEYRCHLTNDGTMTAVETDVFDGKCRTYIEGCRCVPEGESWTRSDGAVFRGLMVASAGDFRMLAGAQKQYELDEAAFAEELGALIDEIYNEDLEEIG